MKFGRLIACGAAALAFGLAASAEARIVTVTYQGVVTFGYDVTGVFGAPGADLGGASFTVVYKIDESGSGATNNNPPISSQISGGTFYGIYPPVNQSPVSATLTINGGVLSNSGEYNGVAIQSTLASGTAGVYNYAEERYLGQVFGWNQFINAVESNVNPIVTSYLYDAPLSYAAQPGDNGYGSFQDVQYTYDGSGNLVTLTYAYGTLDATSVTVALGAVPEPATWAMLILGVGMIGFAARRRHGLAAAA